MNVKKLKAASGDKSQCSGFLHFKHFISYILFDDVTRMHVDIRLNVDEVRNSLWRHMNVKKLKTASGDESQCLHFLHFEHFILYILFDDVTRMHVDIRFNVDEVRHSCDITWMLRN